MKHKVSELKPGDSVLDRLAEQRKLRVYIDGVQVTNLRAVSLWPDEGVRMYVKGPSDYAAWWRIEGDLPPLTPGQHSVRFHYPVDGPDLTKEMEWMQHPDTREWLFRHVPPPGETSNATPSR